MKRVVDNKIIRCPICDNIMKESSYEVLLKRDNGKELIQFTLICPNSSCETEVVHTTFMSYERGDVIEDNDQGKINLIMEQTGLSEEEAIHGIREYKKEE